LNYTFPYLGNAALYSGGVSWQGSSYDTLVDLFECLGNFLECLRIYIDVPLTPAMTEIMNYSPCLPSKALFNLIGKDSLPSKLNKADSVIIVFNTPYTIDS